MRETWMQFKRNEKHPRMFDHALAVFLHGLFEVCLHSARQLSRRSFNVARISFTLLRECGYMIKRMWIYD